MQEERDMPPDAPHFDVRGALAALCGSLGVLLIGFGLATRSDQQVYIPSGGVNVNLRWGMVLLGFAALMAIVSLFSSWARREEGGGVAPHPSSDSHQPSAH